MAAASEPPRALPVEATPQDAPPVSERVQRRLLGTLFSAQSVSNAAQSVSFTTLPLAAYFLTGTEAVAGIPATVTLVGRAMIAYPIGWLMDRVGRRLGIALGLLLSVFGTSLLAAGVMRGSFSLFLVGALFNGFGRGTGEQSRYAAADVVPASRASNAIGTVVFAGTIGAVIGPLLIAPASRAAVRAGWRRLPAPIC